ncbi:MAG: hypothetical protein JNL56_14450 [Alphaproteobacteria bacterium]|nr:hypothetical protein [Alphaproteobacteria bacterium]
MIALDPAHLPALALYAGAIGVLGAIALARDALERRPPGAGREAVLAPLGLAALIAALAAGAPGWMRLLAGALVLTGLALSAAAPRDPGRASPGRRIGTLAATAGIAVGLAASFLPLAAGPEQTP